MRHWPSRLRRLDDALDALPLDDPMLVSELDGYLTGILLSREPIAPEEWLQGIWGIDEGGVPPFEDPADVRWFVDAVTAHLAVIARDVARGKPQPIFDIDDRNGDLLWELWVDGFAQAMELRPEAWDAIAEGSDAGAAEALSRLSTLIAVALGESDLDSVQINALQESVAATIVDIVLRFHAARADSAAPAILAAPAAVAKVGRNDPCVCGSGRKSKRCCGG